MRNKLNESIAKFEGKCVHFLIDVVHGVAVVVAETFKLEART